MALLIFTIKIIFIDAFGNNCFEDTKQSELGHNKMKAMVICSQPQTSEQCKEILHSNSIYESTLTILESSCKKEGHEIASIHPLSTPIMMSITSLWSNLDLGQRRKYVNSVVDFHHHTKMHKKRVVELAVELFKQYPKQFNGLNEAMIRRVLKDHDNAKIDAKYTYKNGKPFYEMLYQSYGKKPPIDVIEQLNKIDSSIMEDALKKEGLTFIKGEAKEERIRKMRMRQKLSKLEKLADFVDRAMNPVSSEEFGRKMCLESSVAKTEIAKKMALFLENNYKTITNELNYYKMSGKEYFQLAQNIKLDKSYRLLLNSGRTTKEIGARAISGLSNIAKSRGFFGFRSVGGKVIMGASIALDGFLLAAYSNSISCDSVSASHDWEINDSRCIPTQGFSDRVIKYLSLPREEQEIKLVYGGHLCQILTENVKIGEEQIFTNISCTPKKAKFEVNKGEYIEAKYDFEGNVMNVKLNNMKNYISGILGTEFNQLRFGTNGKIESVCNTKGNRGMTKCYKANIGGFLSKTSNVMNFYYSMNYKIQQGIACCLGKTNEYNKNISCSI